MKEWIADFFACGPGFDLDRITGRGTPYREDIQRLLCSFLEISTKQSRFCALPMVLGDDKVVQILIGATSPEESAELRNIAEAFVGTAYGLVGKEIVSTPIDQASAAILARFPGGLVRIRVPRGVDTSSAYQERANRAMRVVLEMLEQYARRPAMLSETRRPTGRVLRDLFSSLRERDEPASISCLEELKSLKALSARNCVYLELQVRAALGDWRSVLNHPWLPDILPTRLPGRVTVALLAALEESYALTHITTENLSELREVVRPFAPIFERRPKRSSLGERIEYWRTWAVGAALVGNQKDVRQLYADLEDAWIRRLCRLFDWDTEDALSAPRVENELQRLLTLPETEAVGAALLKKAIDCTGDDYKAIVDHLSGFSDRTKECLWESAPLRAVWEATVGCEISQSTAIGWSNWLDQVELAKDSDAEALLQAAIDSAHQWDGATWDEERFARSIYSPSEAVLKILRDVIPILLDWIEEHDLRLRSDTVEAILDCLAVDDVTSVPDLALARDLLAMVVDGPVDRKSYSSMVDAFGVIWDKVESPQALPRMLDIFDLLLDAPCPSQEARRKLWDALQRFLMRAWARLEPEYHCLARNFAVELMGSSDQFDVFAVPGSDAEPASQVDLRGRKLAIYSRIEKAAQRAKAVLEGMFAGLNVELNHDETATDALNHLSRSADYFVFSSRSAAHQAFYPVSRQRNDIIYPKGKGTASIVRAFCEAVASV